MMAEPSLPKADASRREALEPQDALVAPLLDALEKLAKAGAPDAACRIAGRACAILRTTNPAGMQRFNALLHRIARLSGPVGGSA